MSGRSAYRPGGGGSPRGAPRDSRSDRRRGPNPCPRRRRGPRGDRRESPTAPGIVSSRSTSPPRERETALPWPIATRRSAKRKSRPLVQPVGVVHRALPADGEGEGLARRVQAVDGLRPPARERGSGRARALCVAWISPSVPEEETRPSRSPPRARGFPFPRPEADTAGRGAAGLDPSAVRLHPFSVGRGEKETAVLGGRRRDRRGHRRRADRRGGGQGEGPQS